MLSLFPAIILTARDERRIERRRVSFTKDAACVCVCVSLAVTVCSREERIAQEAAFPSIFFLSDRGLPLYPPFFLSRGQTSET